MMDIQDIQMQLSDTINASIEILEDMGKTRLYDEYDFPKDDRRVEELIDFIAQTDSWSGNPDFEVGYLKGLEMALRIVMKS